MFRRIVLCTALIMLGMALSLNAQPQPSPVQPSPIKRTILDGQPERVLHAGESVAFPDRAIHNEGATDKPVKLYSVYVVETGNLSPRQLNRGRALTR
jgi:hypothetical protein